MFCILARDGLQLSLNILLCSSKAERSAIVASVDRIIAKRFDVTFSIL
jgi:hypothetical protein